MKVKVRKDRTLTIHVETLMRLIGEGYEAGEEAFHRTGEGGSKKNRVLEITRRATGSSIRDGGWAGTNNPIPPEARADGRNLPMWRQLEQRKLWRTKEGEWVKIRTLETSHLLSILAMLERRASANAWDYYSRGVWADAPDDVQSLVERVISHPYEWTRTSPLYQAILAEVVSRVGTEQR
jgi:hypothetical protein